MKPTLWIDTNVMNEIYSHGDLHRDARHPDRERAGKLAQDRRAKLEGSYWLAMALDEQHVTTVSYEHEGRRTLLALAPPDQQVGAWTSGVLYVLRPYVFPGWSPLTTNEGHELPLDDSDARDQLIVDICKRESLALITRDRGARRRAQRARVEVTDPETYAERVLAHDVARDRFMERLHVGGTTYALNAAPDRPGALLEAMGRMRHMYRLIWRLVAPSPAGDPTP